MNDFKCNGLFWFFEVCLLKVTAGFPYSIHRKDDMGRIESKTTDWQKVRK